MAKQLQDTWAQAREYMKEELTSASYDSWIRTLRPMAIESGALIIEAPSNFNRNIVNQNYVALIKTSIKAITNMNYDVRIVLPGEFEPAPDAPAWAELSAPDTAAFPALNPRYTFETFVTGNSNRFAYAAARAVAESPANAYNPLFIYGGTGLGKTHLMHAIGHYILTDNPRTRVLYATSDKFTDDLIKAIQTRKNEEFRERYRNVDVLMIDDIQFIAGKVSTMEEIFHTFNALHNNNKQIILSSDKQPQEIPQLEDRLRSRFSWGMLADIQLPDVETRMAILRRKVELETLDVDDSVIELIASSVESNIRELEGFMTRCVLYSNLTHRPLNLELAREALGGLLPQSEPRKITPDLVQDAVCRFFKLKSDDFRSKRRSQDISLPRQIAMYLCREMTDLSLPKIGESFGGRDHSTILHGIDKISTLLETDVSMRGTISELKRRIAEGG